MLPAAPRPCRGVDERRVRSAPSDLPRQRHHRPVEAAVRLEDTRRIDQQQLRVALDRDAINLARVVWALGLTIATFCRPRH